MSAPCFYAFLFPPHIYSVFFRVSVCSLLLPSMLKSTALRVEVETLCNAIHSEHIPIVHIQVPVALIGIITGKD